MSRKRLRTSARIGFRGAWNGQAWVREVRAPASLNRGGTCALHGLRAGEDSGGRIPGSLTLGKESTHAGSGCGSTHSDPLKKTAAVQELRSAGTPGCRLRRMGRMHLCAAASVLMWGRRGCRAPMRRAHFREWRFPLLKVPRQSGRVFYAKVAGQLVPSGYSCSV